MKTQEVSPQREDELFHKGGRAQEQLHRESPSLETSQTHLDVFLCQLLHDRGLDSSPEAPLNCNYSMIV